MQISAFADEVSANFQEQVAFLNREAIRFIELRFVDGINALDLSEEQLKQAKVILDDSGIGVSAVGSPIGKVRIDEPFGPHLDRFKHAIDVALALGTRFIRIFSYYPPEGGTIDDHRDTVLERMAKKTELAEQTELVLVHENETGIYGHSAENCRDLAEQINSEVFRLVFDPGNFVWGAKIRDCFEACWPLMSPYTVHIHIKDWTLNARVGAIPGQGDGQIPELIRDLKRREYDGFLTLEPHLEVGGQFGGCTGPALYSKAVAALRRLIDEG